MDAVKGSLPFFRKSLEKMHSSRKCPLCTRGFEDKASFDRTVKSVSGWEQEIRLLFQKIYSIALSLSLQITDRLNASAPRLLPALEDKQRQLRERQKRLQELRPKIEEVPHKTCGQKD